METPRVDCGGGADRRGAVAVSALTVLRQWQRRAWLVLLIGACLILACRPVVAATAATVRIPEASVRYRLQLERAAGEQWGLQAPVARLAAQLHQESAWNPRARSPYAQGLAQFTPATARWLPSVCPAVGAPDPWSPTWSMRAVACFDAWLYRRAPGATPCDRWAMTLSAYNGGEGARDREIRLAYHARDEPPVWFDQVARFKSRSDAAWRENREYVRHILLVLEPVYLAADWPGTRVCP